MKVMYMLDICCVNGDHVSIHSDDPRALKCFADAHEHEGSTAFLRIEQCHDDPEEAYKVLKGILEARVSRTKDPAKNGWVIWPDYTITELEGFDYERDWSYKSDDYLILWAPPDYTAAEVLQIAKNARYV